MKKSALTVLSLFLLPTLLKADGQGFLVYVADGEAFVYAFIIWTSIVFIFMFVAKLIRKKAFTNKQKYLIYIIGGALALFHWSMIKYDPNPYDGPIDSFINRGLLEENRIKDSVELVNGKPDSTIETTIASIDNNEVGVYIWLNHKEVFVRKITPEPDNWRLQDSLTMYIVRNWKKK